MILKKHTGCVLFSLHGGGGTSGFSVQVTKDGDRLVKAIASTESLSIWNKKAIRMTMVDPRWSRPEIAS